MFCNYIFRMQHAFVDIVKCIGFSEIGRKVTNKK